MSTPRPTAICPQCFREVPRTMDDPDGSWEKCADCDGLFLAEDTKIPKPDKTRISVQRDRERISFRCPPRTSLIWRSILGFTTIYLAIVLVAGIFLACGFFKDAPPTLNPFAYAILGWVVYKLVRMLFLEQNVSSRIVCDGDTMFAYRRELFFLWTTKIPMSEIIRLESKPLKETEKEKERSLTFHYFDPKHRPKGLTIYLSSQAEENWLLDELHDFLKSTPSGSPMVPFAYWANHPSDTLMVRPVGDSMFVQVFCRRCGMKIPATNLDLKTGEAVCRQKNCGERFNWWEVPPDPEPTDAEVKTFRRIYATYSDVRTFHFSDAINPFSAPFKPRDPIPLSSLRKPKRSDVSRPTISWNKERLKIQVEAKKPFGIFQWLLSFFLTSLLLMLVSVLFVVGFPYSSLRQMNDFYNVMIGVGIAAALFAVVVRLFYRAIMNGFIQHWGQWTLTLNQAEIRFGRRCLWSSFLNTIPLERLNGFYVLSNTPTNSIIAFPESFANYLVRFDAGKKSYHIPCANEEHRNWVASEIVDYLAVHGWDAGNGVVQKINNELRPVVAK